MRIGIALGSGAARGFAHVGVLRELEALGVRPSVVCGSSMGALVAAAYAAGRLEAFEGFARRLDQATVLGLFDVSFRGGLIQARRLFEFLAEDLPDRPIAELPLAFGAVATDLGSGREVWLTEGPLHAALRASIALPGLIAPVRHGNRWLTDGGLVNPVPVSLCRSLGAEAVIAVELEATRPVRFLPGEEDDDDDDAGGAIPRRSEGREGGPGADPPPRPPPVSPRNAAEAAAARLRALEDDGRSEGVEASSSAPAATGVGDAPDDGPGDGSPRDEEAPGDEGSGPDSDLGHALGRLAERIRKGFWGGHDSTHHEPARKERIQPPSVYEVISQVVYLMQVRITRHRLAGEPPDLHVRPQLAGLGLLDFHRADEAIEEGRRAVRAALAAHRLVREDPTALSEEAAVRRIIQAGGPGRTAPAARAARETANGGDGSGHAPEHGGDGSPGDG